MSLTFPRRGHRKKEGYGLTYRSCESPDYALYFGDQVAGVRWRDHDVAERWLVIVRNRVVSRHRKRRAAERELQRIFTQENT